MLKFIKNLLNLFDLKKESQLLYSQILANVNLWLLFITGLIIFIQLSLFIKYDEGRLFENFILFGCCIAYLIWNRIDVLTFESDFFSSMFGTTLIGLIILKSISLTGYDPFLRIISPLLFFGMACIASGFSGLKQYWKEFILISFSVPPPSTISRIFDISPFSATLGETILHYAGFQVVRDNVFIYTPQGSVEVYYGCSGIESMIHILGIAFLLIALFPTTFIQRIILPVIGLLIAFLINGFRISLLTLLSSPNQKQAFDFWHAGTGSLIFSLLSVILFGIIFYFFFYRNSLEFVDHTEIH